MTPYQRGHRDALLALAVEIEVQSNKEQVATPLSDDYVIGSAKHQAVIMSRSRSHTMRNDALLARRRAEALPHDPEEVVNDP